MASKDKRRSTLIKDEDKEGVFNQVFFANPGAQAAQAPEDYADNPGYYDKNPAAVPGAVEEEEAGGLYNNMGGDGAIQEDGPTVDIELQEQHRQTITDEKKNMYAEYTPMPQKWTPIGDAAAFVNRDKGQKKISTTKLLIIILVIMGAIGAAVGIAVHFATGSSSSNSTSASSGTNLKCQPGFGPDANNNNTCTICQISFFSLGQFCFSCGTNRNTTGLGADSFDDCLCVPGYTGKNGIDEACTACGENFYKNVTGSSPCVACPSGTFSSSGASACA